MSNGTQTAQRLEVTTTRELSVRYLLFLPQNYEAAQAQRWPLLLFLHGAGERGTNLSKVALHGPPRLVQSQPDFPFIVVSPQCPSGQLWSNDLLLALLEEVIRKRRVDPERVYLTGLSMGGYGAWRVALDHPERFAAVVPVCGGGDILQVLLATPPRLRKLRTLGIWAFHGARDAVVPLIESERMVAAVRSVGNKAKLTVYPNAEHDSWTETYDNPALYSWFLTHRRRKAYAPPRPSDGRGLG
jgi:predicted peptidase